MRTQRVATAAKRGRRRSERARRAILEATVSEWIAHGPAALTVDRIAAAAGASKATIYRWWPSKEDLLADALGALLEQILPIPHTGSARGDLLEMLEHVVTELSNPTGRILPDLVVESRSNPAIADILRTMVARRRAQIVDVLERGLASGELRADLDVEAVTDLVIAAVPYRVLTGDVDLDPALPRRLVDALWPAIAASGG